jgi:hypothetical protein
MAATYTWLGSYPDTEYLGGTATRPVTAEQYQTVPHSVYFESRIPDASLTQEEVDNTGKVNSEALENLFNITAVIDVEWTQVTKPSGYIYDQVVIYFQTPSGLSSGEVVTPFTGISNEVVEALIEPLLEKLEAIEAL